jgi:membrane fusion protein (multidrug efflux system)
LSYVVHSPPAGQSQPPGNGPAGTTFLRPEQHQVQQGQQQQAPQATAQELQGVLIHYDRKWTQWAYVLVFLVALGSFAFCCLFSVNDYASGPAVVRVDGKRTVTAATGGVVDSFNVKPGQLVKEGDLIVRLHDADEIAEVKRSRQEYEQQLVRLMLEPSDQTAKTALSALSARREQAMARLGERRVKAPIPGVVSDIRIRPGQRVEAGEVLCGISPTDAKVSIVAVVPGDYRPQLTPNQAVRFALDGYAYEYQDLTVETIGDGVVGPTEVKRFLGQEIWDSVHMGLGAKVLVSARIPNKTFTSQGETYAFYDGLTGVAEIRVRDEPIVVTLLPFLKALLTK